MSDAKKRKKNYYLQSSKKKKLNDLDVGMKGFLLTCNNKEKGTVREAYNILNEYADNLYGTVQVINTIINTLTVARHPWA